MTSVLDGNEGKVAVALVVSNDSSLEGPVGHWLSYELALSGPLHVGQKLFSTNVVADQVEHSVVNEDGDVGSKDGGDIELEAFLTVDTEHAVDFIVASLPGDSLLHAQLLLDGGIVEVVGDIVEVVAEGRGVARQLVVVNVDVTGSLEDVLHDLRANRASIVPILLVDVLGALLVSLVHGAVDGIVDQTSFVGERTISAILSAGIDPTVADTDARKVDGLSAGVLVSNEDLSSDGRDVMSSVALTNDVERKLGVLRVLSHEGGEEGVHVGGDLLLVLDVI